jgi:C4-dicarboxylate-specific signal transduction histidine kinase
VEQKELDVNELIRDVSRLTQRAAVGARVSMRLSLTETLPRLVGDPIQLEQVFLNLVVNAIDAMSQDETGPRDLTIRTWSEEKSSVEVAVADSAPPVSKEILEMVPISSKPRCPDSSTRAERRVNTILVSLLGEEAQLSYHPEKLGDG